MNKSERIREGLKKFSSQFGPAPTLLAIVQSVDEENQTCVLIDDDNDGTVYNDVRLRPVIDGNSSVVIFPTVGTYALAIMIEGGEDADWMLLAAGQIDKVIYTCGVFILTVSNTGFSIKSNEDSLKNILNDFSTAIQQLTVTAPNGVTSVPINAAAFAALTTRINALMYE